MGEPATMTRRRIRCSRFPPVFGTLHSTVTRSHITSCELLTSGVPWRGLLPVRHLFVIESAPKRAHCLTAFESAPFVFNRLEWAGRWRFEQGSGWSKIAASSSTPNVPITRNPFDFCATFLRSTQARGQLWPEAPLQLLNRSRG